MKHLFTVLVLLMIVSLVAKAQSVKVEYINLAKSKPVTEFLIANGSKSLFYNEAYDAEVTESEEKGAYGLPAEVLFDFGSGKNYIYKNQSENFLVSYMTDFYGDYYKIEDSVDIQQWNIIEEINSVAGYRVQKAITHFRGRDYEAWFSADIPLANGPWKFGGLPGIILEVKESTGMLHYKAESIEVLDENLVISEPDLKKVKRTDHKNFIELYYDQLEDYFEFKEAQLRKDGSNIKITLNRPKIELLEKY